MLSEQVLNSLFSEDKNDVWIGTWRSPMQIEVAEDIAVFMSGNRKGELFYVDGHWEGNGFKGELFYVDGHWEDNGFKGELFYVDGHWEDNGFSFSPEDLIVAMNDGIITRCPNVTASNALVRVIGLLYHTSVEELDADVRAVLKTYGTSNFVAICEILKLSGGDSIKLEALQIGALCISEMDELDVEMVTLAAEIMIHALDFIDTLFAV